MVLVLSFTLTGSNRQKSEVNRKWVKILLVDGQHFRFQASGRQQEAEIGNGGLGQPDSRLTTNDSRLILILPKIKASLCAIGRPFGGDLEHAFTECFFVGHV